MQSLRMLALIWAETLARHLLRRWDLKESKYHNSVILIIFNAYTASSLNHKRIFNQGMVKLEWIYGWNFRSLISYSYHSLPHSSYHPSLQSLHSSMPLHFFRWNSSTSSSGCGWSLGIPYSQLTAIYSAQISSLNCPLTILFSGAKTRAEHKFI
jgi:hypothetical protein